jgi:type IX secretion system PorP/SprF family membrane protein
MKRILVLMLALPVLVKAQSQLNITAASQNIMFFNPAFAGSDENVNFVLLHKSQWVSQPNSPVLTGFSAQMPVNYERFGVGVNVLRESAGIVQSLYANANLSYKINFSRGRLSFGLRLGLLQRTENVTKLLIKDQGDALAVDQRELNPDFSGGLFYKDKKCFIGASFTRSSGIYINQQAALKNYYTFIAGRNFLVSDRLQFKPYIISKYTQEFNPTAMVMLPLEYRKLFSLGVGYNSTNVLSVQSSLSIDKMLGASENSYTITYAYDQSMSIRNNYIGNTHELTLSIRLVQGEKLDRILKRKVTVSPLLFD